MDIRSRLQALVADPRTQTFIIVLILINAVTLGLETSEAAMQRAGGRWWRWTG